jgi:hypothetical protein
VERQYTSHALHSSESFDTACVRAAAFHCEESAKMASLCSVKYASMLVSLDMNVSTKDGGKNLVASTASSCDSALMFSD